MVTLITPLWVGANELFLNPTLIWYARAQTIINELEFKYLSGCLAHGVVPDFFPLVVGLGAYPM